MGVWDKANHVKSYGGGGPTCVGDSGLVRCEISTFGIGMKARHFTKG